MRKSVKFSLFDGWNYAPNIVTYVRIVLAIVFIGLYLASGVYGVHSVGARWGAFVIFALAASTDKLDGYLARKYNQVTELGKLLDPIADKLLILSALIIGAIFSEIPWIVTLLFVVREIGITVLRFYVIKRGGKVIAASSLGKYKTVAQSLGLALILLPVVNTIVNLRKISAFGISYLALADALIYIALLLALCSGYTYTKGAFAALSALKDGDRGVVDVESTLVSETSEDDLSSVDSEESFTSKSGKSSKSGSDNLETEEF